MKSTGWWLLQGCLDQFLKIYLITHVLHGGWRNCSPSGACLFSACLICTFSCLVVWMSWKTDTSRWVKEITQDPSSYNWCHQLNGVSNIWELSATHVYIYLSAPYWCNRWLVTEHNPPWCLWLQYHTTVWPYITAGALLFKMIWLINTFVRFEMRSCCLS
mgnify:CR=1 FL=1